MSEKSPTREAEARRLEQLRALADPTRLRILELLKRPGCCSLKLPGKRAGMCVCDLQAPLGLTQPTITHHLKVLREAGLIECRKLGAWLYCERNEKALKELGAAIAAA